MLTDFKAGKLNLLIATAVAEEGLDLTHCRLVVRYDLPKTPLEFIQSRGRARARDSRMVLMVEDGNETQLAFLADVHGSAPAPVSPPPPPPPPTSSFQLHIIHWECLDQTTCKKQTDQTLILLFPGGSFIIVSVRLFPKVCLPREDRFKSDACHFPENLCIFIAALHFMQVRGEHEGRSHPSQVDRV